MKTKNPFIIIDKIERSETKNLNAKHIRNTILKNQNNERFEISIKLDAHSSDNYITLSKWSDSNGWNKIVTKHPVKDYKLNGLIFEMKSFDKIDQDMIKIAIEFQTHKEE